MADNPEEHARRIIPLVGGRVRKWTSPGVTGVPDDIIFWPVLSLADGHTENASWIHFVEFKTGKDVLSTAQKREAKWLLEAGFRVFVFRTREQVDDYVRQVQTDLVTARWSGSSREIPGLPGTGELFLGDWHGKDGGDFGADPLA